MPTVEVSHVSKSFGSLQAVRDLSFEVRPGEIFGLLGPNGAGKTTTIRLMLDIFKPDRGRIAVLGGPMSEGKKNRIGYMPEERGLYQDVRLDRCLAYLGSLKGLHPREVRPRLDGYLERFGLAEFRKKKLKELSKGMQQKAQLIATLLHEPELLIIDEPFSGLDPVNSQAVKALLLELRARGVTIIMSTHQMHQVEELCDRILLVNRGRAMLYGEVEAVRRRFSGNAVLVKPVEALAGVPGVAAVERHHTSHRVELDAGVSPQELLKTLVARDIRLDQFEVALPSLDEIFVRVVQGEAPPV